MKKIKKFIREKGGLKVILWTLFLILIAGVLIITGVVYNYYGGDWGKIPEILSSDFAISCYVISGVIIMILVFMSIIAKRNEEIE